MSDAERITGRTLTITGIVQGVGFRPTVARVADHLQLQGHVRNTNSGVEISIWGEPETLDQFLPQLKKALPSQARIDQIQTIELAAQPSTEDKNLFRIIESHDTGSSTGIIPDMAICPECQQNIFSPQSRFYHYPFTSCTLCGPRYSVVTALPYDRQRTSLINFTLCPRCKEEYEDTSNRRYHAQSLACPQCGPQLWLEDNSGNHLEQRDKAIQQTVALLKKGAIVAIRGLGGYHLACDSQNSSTIEKLRKRKRRPHKAFALMAKNIAMVEQYADMNEKARELLQSPQSPVVLLPRKMPSPLPESIAPGLRKLGFMLPYTGLHLLLCDQLDSPLVMTSANISGDVLCYTNDEARKNLSQIADFFLMHDREIVNPVDDSVVTISDESSQIIRLARGYTPTYIPLPAGFQTVPVLAMGSELKNTFCLIQNGHAIISPQLGDLGQAGVFRRYQQEIQRFGQFFNHHPVLYAVDKHPDYHSTQQGKQLAKAEQARIQEIQHHHAHITACMAEHGLPIDHPPVLGIVMDGMGAGENQTIWGGEFFLATYSQCTHIAGMQAVPLPGGAKAMLQPWRNLWAYLFNAGMLEKLQLNFAHLPSMASLKSKPLPSLANMVNRKINSPEASSCGRLFDAVAAALGICIENISYEGQAAMELESLAEYCPTSVRGGLSPYPFHLRDSATELEIDWHALWQPLLSDTSAKTENNALPAYRFHLTLATAILSVITRLKERHHSFSLVALSGGVFQNQLLLKTLFKLSENRDINYITPETIPTNDAGLSLGQAMVSLAKFPEL